MNYPNQQETRNMDMIPNCIPNCRRIAAVIELHREIAAIKRERDLRRARRFKAGARDRGVNPYADVRGLVQS